MSKLIVILGPTASGKSSLAIMLAKKFKGEIISADSRQVYKGMDIGTGKISKKEQRTVAHYLIDVASPKKQFTVADFKKLTSKAIEQIEKKNKVPFVVGGTAFYIYSLIDNWQIPEVAPNKKLRKVLRNKSTNQLFKILQKLDPARAKNIDINNPVRLIRAIEIVKATGVPVPHFAPYSPYPPLLLGIRKDQNELYKLIDKRVRQRFKKGLVKETLNLLKNGIPKRRIREIGLTYRIILDYLEKSCVKHIAPPRKKLYSELTEKVIKAEQKFSKRQMTWFKRDQRINWITNSKQAEKLVNNYLNN